MPPHSDDSSDNESTGAEIPFKKTNNAANDSGDEEGSEEGEDVYVVESIVGHEFQGKILMLNVKWKGYDDPADQTLEPEEGLLEGAEDAVKEYYSKIGGRPEPPSKPGRGKRKSMTASAKDTPERTTSKKQKTSKQETNGTEVFVGTDIPRGIPDWVRDKDHWEEDVAKVQTITHDEDRNLVAYLIWTNGKTTKVSIGLCYEKIPMLMLKFYEAHLVFKNEGAEDE
ncbi:hypothetical protein TCE0_015f01987 [Talaromyces pinophilus]|uniref:Chromo domain-containing protein n=1 Tax=Talaromyces pinophilus TaxID=128442 RepID=A0A6V8GZD5_TALPI|nr:hypothetical protein PENOC_061120 [Penicillium occitanis (nom. inval.)]PCH03547.1 Chromo domain/shadow [Penicillium occitanis (nom. inval.)]GAM34418.1 hypothetical protein TCE0_015f01987 [Talaromyces pinophilus]